MEGHYQMFKTDLAYENWSGKYQYGNETPIETWRRVATALASVEEDQDKWAEEFLNLIVIPNHFYFEIIS